MRLACDQFVRLVICLILIACGLVSAQSAAPELPAGELVRLAVANEVTAGSAPVRHMFHSRRQTPKGSQTRLYVETKDAMAGMLIAINDRPLTSQQQDAEIGHLDWLMGNPDQLRKKQAREKEDAERTMRIVKALPDAFRYQYDGTENSTEGLGKEGEALVRLKFTSNPGYSPPSRVEQVLTGMQGYLLIDATSRRLARIDGTLTKDVSFGWGIIGHLDKGGHFRVQQADIGDGTWDITEMSLSITGRILLFKGLSMVSDDVFSDFRRVPDGLTFAQGAEMLKTEQQRMAHETGLPNDSDTTRTPHQP